MNEPRTLTIAELAEDAFLKGERLTSLGMLNTPKDFEDRKKAFIELAEARAAHVAALNALNSAISGGRNAL